jgi:hypothetical protein
VTRYLTPPVLGLIGVVIIAAILAFVLSGLLVGDAALLTLGVAIGFLLGVPLGGVAVWMAYRDGHKAGRGAQSPTVALTPDQSEALLRALERQQTSTGAFGLTTRKGRDISAVGGADLASLGSEPDQGQS